MSIEMAIDEILLLILARVDTREHLARPTPTPSEQDGYHTLLMNSTRNRVNEFSYRMPSHAERKLREILETRN